MGPACSQRIVRRAMCKPICCCCCDKTEYTVSDRSASCSCSDRRRCGRRSSPSCCTMIGRRLCMISHEFIPHPSPPSRRHVFSVSPPTDLQFARLIYLQLLLEMGIESNQTRGHKEPEPDKNPVAWVRKSSQKPSLSQRQTSRTSGPHMRATKSIASQCFPLSRRVSATHDPHVRAAQNSSYVTVSLAFYR